MLQHRVRGSDGLWHLNDEHQYFAILYHAVVHKGHIGVGYLDEVHALSKVCTLTAHLQTWASCLKQWMEPRYEFSNTCHNCGGSYLAQVGLADICGHCEQEQEGGSVEEVS